MTVQTSKPKVGDPIYIPSSMSIDMTDGIHGGLATIESVTEEFGDPFVLVEELPNHSFNYNFLSEVQDKLKKEFGTKTARPEPDFGKDTKKILVRKGKDGIDEALNSLSTVMYTVLASPDLFEAGDQHSIKAMKLGLLRLREKLVLKKKK